METATVYSDKLAGVLSGSDAQMIDKLTKHWVRACYYICRLGLNDASLRLVDTSEAIDDLVSIGSGSPLLSAVSRTLRHAHNNNSGTYTQQRPNLEAPLRACSI